MFDSMFCNLDYRDDTIDDVPVFFVSETSKVLEVVLSLCYPPYRSPSLEPTEESLLAAMDAARKYYMGFAYQSLAGEFMRFLDEGHAMQLYVTACNRRWVDGMRLAAKASLKEPLPDSDVAMAGLTGSDYLHLLRYRQRCTDAIQGVVNHPKYTFRNSAPGTPYVAGDAIPVSLRRGNNIHNLWRDIYLSAAREQLAARPHGQVVYDSPLAVRLLRVAFEAGLRDEAKLSQVVFTFQREFSEALDAAIATVSESV